MASVVAVAAVLLALGWAGLARRETAVRERLARRFTESVERIEALARYSDLSHLHDTRADQRVIRARMAALEAEVQDAGEQAVGPGHYALGRGYLALGDEARAREALEAAWSHGFREPRVAYALALVTGHQYQEQLSEAERLRDAERREAEAPAGAAEVPRKQRAARLDWATLLKRSFDFDVFTCPGCGGRRRGLAVLNGPGVKEVLSHLGWPTLPLPLASARGPPQGQWLH